MTLFSHTWKSSVRSILWGRELAANIFIAVMLSMLALNLLGLGLFIRPLLEKTAPDDDPIAVVNGVLLWYFLLDLVMRIILQKIPSMEVLSYLLLPVGKRRIIRFMLLRMVFSGFNILPLFALIPIALTLLLPIVGAASMLAWLVACLGLMLLSNITVFIIDKVQSGKTRTIPILGAGIAAFLLLDYTGMIDVTASSAFVFGTVVSSPGISAAWLLFVLLVVEGATGFLKDTLNLGSLLVRPQAAGGGSQSRILERFDGGGAIARFISLEMKLMLRNSRARSSFGVMILVVLLVPLYYTFMLPTFMGGYTMPETVPVSEILEGEVLPEERSVRFVVQSDDIPPDAWVFMTGNQSVLGNWTPDHIPLRRNTDSSWSRTIPFIEGVSVRYIFTLGSWQNEAAIGEDGEPDVHEFLVSKDTTLVSVSPTWKIPSLDGFEVTMVLYMAFLLVGMVMLVYGQFLFVWESNYFDLLLTRPIDINAYLRSKYYILLVLSIAGFLVSIPTFFISTVLIPVHIAASLYTIGVNSFLIMFWAMLSKKRLDLTASIFSTQGKGGSNFATIIPILLVPIAIFLLSDQLLARGTGMLVLAGLGLAGVLSTRPLLRRVEAAYQKKKYTMREGFRAS